MQTTGQKTQVGDVITLNDRAREWTRGREFTVDELRPWGVICYAKVGISESPHADAPAGVDQFVITTVDDGKAYYRATFDEIAGKVHA